MNTGAPRQFRLSVVVPFFNEEECVRQTYDRIRAFAETNNLDFEMVCVNDGSADSTLGILRDLHANDSRVKVVSFSRNFGHQVAVTAGIHYASGDCVITMDGDLQDPPEVMAAMIQKWHEGYKVVYGVRKNRKEHWFKRLCYFLFYRIFQKISAINVPLDAGDFCLMDRKIVLEMQRFSEDRPFVRGLRSWVGYKQVGVEYDRAPRLEGETKYSFLRLATLALDGWISFSDTILRAGILVGLIVSSLSLCVGSYVLLRYLAGATGVLKPVSTPPGWASLACALMFLLGLLFTFLGIIGEYVGRISSQVKGRPLYIVEEEIGFDNA